MNTTVLTNIQANSYSQFIKSVLIFENILVAGYYAVAFMHRRAQGFSATDLVGTKPHLNPLQRRGLSLYDSYALALMHWRSQGPLRESVATGKLKFQRTNLASITPAEKCPSVVMPGRC